MGVWPVGDSAQTCPLSDGCAWFLGEAFALASVTVLLLLGAISWSLLTAKDQVYSNFNSRSCEDELREILELSKLLAWNWVRCTLA